MPAVYLGPFELKRPIGKGGMGEVWRAHHADQDVPVAVKVMTAKVFENEENRTRFKNEVRAVAQLDHPGIVWVFDYGVVTDEAAEASGGRLVAGSPYLAMEHASGGTLASLRRALPWEELRTILLNLLDALAHAHAHGIVHRDLKPANVLICGSRDMRPGIKLTDFGIASAEAVEPAAKEEVVGTLHYMSPEQIRAAAWAQGPHTDLYGLGCLAWRLACGAVPFKGRTGVRLLAAQLHQPLPETEPLLAVPEGFDDWLAALTSKDPAHRFRRAADAAHALIGLGEVDGSTPVPTSYRPIRDPDAITGNPVGDAPALDETDTRFLEEQVTVLALPRVKVEPSRPQHHALAQLRAPLPPGWRRHDATRRSIRLLGAGLGLFGVRTLPMVGRHQERDALWQALHQVHRERSAQLVVVRGAAGTGKSRLAEWLTRRAHEVGSANTLMARFQDAGSSDEPLRRLFLRGVRLRVDQCVDDEMTEAWTRYWGVDSEAVRDALRMLLGPDPRSFDSTTRHAMQRLLLEQMARERPLIVWLDDVQWGLDGLELTRTLLHAQTLRPMPVLVVMTVREEALVDRDQEVSFLQELSSHPRCTTLRLPPLGRHEQARLVQELLGLEPALGAAVEERSGGNPLFAVQLVGDWVQRGILVPGSGGFELAAGESARLPDDLTEVWGERIDRLLADLPRDAASILERTAVIGPEVVSREWRMICDGEEIVPRHEVIRRALRERLFESRLAYESENGWVFAHGLLQETLQARARAAQRWREHNRAAAWMLQSRRRGAVAAERIGIHLLEAGEVQAAIRPMLEGAARVRVTVGRRSALRLLQRCEEAMRGTLPDADRRWGALMLEQATTLHLLGRPEARALAEELHRRATESGWEELQGRGAALLGRLARFRGDLDEADRWNRNALERVREPRNRAELLYELSRLARSRQDAARARVLETEAIQLLLDLGDDAAITTAELYQAEAAWHDEDWRRCAHHAHRGLEITVDLGHKSRMWNLVAEAARAQGDLETAIDALDEAIAIADVIGQGSTAPVLRANQALIHLAREDYARADQVLHDGLYNARLADLPPLVAILASLLVVSSAGLGNWAAFDDHVRTVVKVQGELPTGERDCALALERAAELARAAGHPRRSKRAMGLAADHWAKSGDVERASEARRG